MLSRLLAFGIFLTAAHVALVGTSSAAPPEEEILGQWRWIRSVDYLSDEEETPATTGEERTYIFLASGEFRYIVNGSLHHSDTWSIQDPPSQCDTWGLRIGDIGSFVNCASITQEGQALAMWDSSPVTDGPLEEYERITTVGSAHRSWGTVKTRFSLPR